jgi:hypothetical protein
MTDDLAFSLGDQRHDELSTFSQEINEGGFSRRFKSGPIDFSDALNVRGSLDSNGGHKSPMPSCA